MAEAALYLALRKLVVASERRVYSRMHPDDLRRSSSLRRIESELRMIHCFLGHMETRYNNNQVLMSWIAEARKVGCLVEETVDRVIYSSRKQQEHDGSITRLLRRSVYIGFEQVHSMYFGKGNLRKQVRLIMGLPHFRELEEIEPELEHLSEMKKRWVQMDNGDPYVPAHDIETQSNQELVFRFTNEKPMGYCEEEVKLSAQLHGDENHTHVVAVLGPGGSGKSTLVRFVYEKKRRLFDRHAWISMSGSSTLGAMLVKIRRDLGLEGDTAGIASSDTVDQSVQALTLLEKKFLIVLDDVQVTGGITQICGLFEKGSRIIIITRIKEVATQDVVHDRVELTGLDKYNAVELFCAVTSGKMSKFSTELAGAVYNELITIIPSCMVLPQTIISLGAPLSLKQKSKPVSDHLSNQLKWVHKHNFNLNDIQKCLYVGYNNLPVHLKSCLLYCAIFPVGYVLWCHKLVRLWVAEDFVAKQGESELMEEIAEGYLIELTRRGFLQRVDSDELGRVLSCQMPITVHGLVQSICRKEGFGTACEDSELPQTDSDIRCLYLSRYPQNINALEDFRHLRTLITSENAAADTLIQSDLPRPEAAGSTKSAHIAWSMKSLDSLLRKLAYLTVLELQGSHLRELPDTIGGLFNLRYLGLRNTEVRALPSSIRRLLNMQTLDLKSSRIRKLPYSVYMFKKLRHVFADSSDNGSHQKSTLKGVKANWSVMNWKELQTLETVEASSSFFNRVCKLTMLRSLSLSNMSSKFWRALCTSVEKLLYLSSLSVITGDENEVLDLDLLKAYLEKLVIIRGILAGSLTIECGKQLKSLELSCCTLQNSILDLNHTANLVSLNLHQIGGESFTVKQSTSEMLRFRILKLREFDAAIELDIRDNVLEKLDVVHVECVPRCSYPRLGQNQVVESSNEVPQGEVGESTSTAFQRKTEDTGSSNGAPQLEIEVEEDSSIEPLQTKPRVATGSTTMPRGGNEITEDNNG